MIKPGGSLKPRERLNEENLLLLLWTSLRLLELNISHSPKIIYSLTSDLWLSYLLKPHPEISSPSSQVAFGRLACVCSGTREAVCPLPRTQAHTWPWLASVPVIDRREKVSPAHPGSMGRFVRTPFLSKSRSGAGRCWSRTGWGRFSELVRFQKTHNVFVQLRCSGSTPVPPSQPTFIIFSNTDAGISPKNPGSGPRH